MNKPNPFFSKRFHFLTSGKSPFFPGGTGLSPAAVLGLRLFQLPAFVGRGGL
jgi:hypothetical protein